MLYILLIIIAVGVLLASEAGKELLNWILGVLGVIGGLYLGFWIIIIAIGFFSNKEVGTNISNIVNSAFVTDIIMVLGSILILALIFEKIYKVYAKYKKGELTREIIKTKTKNYYKQHKIVLIFLIFSVCFILSAGYIMPYFLK